MHSYQKYQHPIILIRQVLGYSFGYVGSVILLICLILIQSFDFFGFESSKEATKFTLLVGIWWILFAQITLFYLPEN